MASKRPFPGMDPWLEDYWGDVHARLTTYASDQLQPGLPSGLRARIEEYVTVESRQECEDWRHYFVPDVMITQRSPGSSEFEESAVETLIDTEAVQLSRVADPVTLRRIQIVDTQTGNRVITSIEFLSPANKAGRGWGLHMQKQQDFLDGGVNLVEIDLVRTGAWTVSVQKELVPKNLQSPYRAVVVRATNPLKCEYYPITVSSPLPKVKIPLRPDDADVVLELQPLMELVYLNGGYEDAIDYTRPPKTPLSKALSDWVENWLRQQETRSQS